MSTKRRLTTVLGTALCLAVSAVHAPLAAQEHRELGRMWTFESAPLDWFEAAYGFRPTEQWLDAVRLASLRFGQGCSASFVSPRGLIVTNNHCAQEHVGRVSPDDQDWIVDGFFAENLGQEVRIPGLTVQQLVGSVDVTGRMNDGVTADMDPAARQQKLASNRKVILAARRAGDPDHSHQLVTLYQGGMYQVYSYRVYDDIRLVCAPQVAIAEFGGDPDNFTYPRFCLDFALVRAWEGGEPADTSAHYLRWKTAGPQEGDAVFVTGNPGATGRLNTIAQMEYLRDVQYPRALDGIADQLVQVRRMTEGSPARAKALRPRVLQLENSKKAYTGFLEGLLDPDVIGLKRAAEQRIREKIEDDPALRERFAGAWERLEEIAAEKTRLAQSGEGPPRELLQEEQAVVNKIGEAFFAVYGTEIPPDATFTLRISDGVVKGYPYNGTVAPHFTSLYGLYARHTEFGGEPPFALPELWIERMQKLDLTTPCNLVCTCDIIGGNSGSPLIDTEGRFVGLVFDGNIQSLGNRFVFTDDVARTICVHPAYIIAALRRIYDRPALADELEGKADEDR